MTFRKDLKRGLKGEMVFAMQHELIKNPDPRGVDLIHPTTGRKTEVKTCYSKRAILENKIQKFFIMQNTTELGNPAGVDAARRCGADFFILRFARVKHWSGVSISERTLYFRTEELYQRWRILLQRYPSIPFWSHRHRTEKTTLRVPISDLLDLEIGKETYMKENSR